MATLSDEHQYGVIFMIEAILGRARITHRDRPFLYKPPPGYNSVLAEGQLFPPNTHRIKFSDGRESVIFSGPLSRRRNYTSFINNEFVVYSNSRVQVRFVMLVRL